LVFESLKQALVDVTSLELPDLNRPCVIETDASGVGLGAVLL
jgi:RNase H-like domain found in reverse transcriptase